MSKDLAFVSGCDAHYFPLLLEWVQSLRQHPQSDNADICIMNTGLTDDQVKELEPLVNKIVTPDWPEGIKPDSREFLKSCLCRPFINQTFPGYETYFWMDADTWVQSWKGIDLFLQGAAKGKMALTLQVDRAYPRAVRVKWLGSWPWKVRNFYFSNALKAFDFKTAKTLLPCYVASAGAFALRADAPHWGRWQELVVQAAKKGNPFTAEQLSLGIMTHIEKLPVEALPSWTHWLCEFKPLWDAADQRWVEPYLPHEPLGILHLSGVDEMRLDREVKDEFQTLDGQTIELSYRYPDHSKQLDTVSSPEFLEQKL